MSERHFLVVGGSRGIGKSLVIKLVNDSVNLVSLFSRNGINNYESKKLKQYKVDVIKNDCLYSNLDRAVIEYGKIDCIIFLQRHRSINNEFEIELNVSLSATKNIIEYMIEKKYFKYNGKLSSIVLVSSIADRFIATEQSIGYHLCKSGISQLARYYALTLGHLGIRVNTVSPCVVVKEEALEYWEKNHSLVEKFNKFIPLGRIGNSKDIVNAIMFLTSEDASYITGQNLVVDGGLSLRSHESLIRDI